MTVRGRLGQVPHREVFAGVARRIIEGHDAWDSPHQFMTLHWDGAEVTIGTLAVITPDIHPNSYPDLMAEIARRAIGGERPSTIYAYALQIEGWAVVEPGAQSSEADRLRFEADRIGRTFHERPDAVEMASAWCADVHGRVWSAIKRRNRPEEIEETFWTPGKARGQFVRGLLAIAYETGSSLYGLPHGGVLR